jgi:hypothetical protein
MTSRLTVLSEASGNFSEDEAIFRIYYMSVWPCISNYVNNNQHDALFIFSLLSYHTSTCFGRINSPSSGGRMYILYILESNPHPFLQF